MAEQLDIEQHITLEEFMARYNKHIEYAGNGCIYWHGQEDSVGRPVVQLNNGTNKRIWYGAVQKLILALWRPAQSREILYSQSVSAKCSPGGCISKCINPEHLFAHSRSRVSSTKQLASARQKAIDTMAPNLNPRRHMAR